LHLYPSKRRLAAKEFLEESLICAALVSHVSVISVPSCCYTWTNIQNFFSPSFLYCIFFIYFPPERTRRMHNVRLRLLSACLQVYNHINKWQDLCVCVALMVLRFDTYMANHIPEDSCTRSSKPNYLFFKVGFRSSMSTRSYVLLLLPLDLPFRRLLILVYMRHAGTTNNPNGGDVPPNPCDLNSIAVFSWTSLAAMRLIT